MQKYTDTIKPAHVGDKMDVVTRSGRTYAARGDGLSPSCILTTRFVLAWDVSSTKEGYDAAPLLRRAKDMGGQDSPGVHH